MKKHGGKKRVNKKFLEYMTALLTMFSAFLAGLFFIFYLTSPLYLLTPFPFLFGVAAIVFSFGVGLLANRKTVFA